MGGAVVPFHIPDLNVLRYAAMGIENSGWTLLKIAKSLLRKRNRPAER
jgi:hypothetical protein